VIYDLDAGRPERPGGASVGMTAVTLIAVGLALALFAALAFGPGQRASQRPIFTLGAVSAPEITLPPRPPMVTRPVPDQTLVFPSDVADSIFRITYLGETGGPLRSEGLVTTYRLQASNDLVTVVPLPLAQSLPYPSPAPGSPPLRIRGHDANWIITENGTTAIRWIENGVAFEISSRTLSLAQLTELTAKLR
jgi:hypothetical protein